MRRVDVYKAAEWPTYLVRIGQHVREMDANANRPNGVNMYAGAWDTLKDHCSGHKLTGSDPVPAAILHVAIALVAADVSREER